MRLAIGLPVVLEESASSEGFLTVGANKVLGVPLGSKSVDAIASDRIVASPALGSEESVKVGLAVRSPIPLEEASSGKRLEALGADEMIDVPFLPDGGDAPVKYGFVAVGAFGAVKFLEALLAIGRPVLLEEVPSTQRFPAVTAREMLWVVNFPKRLDDLSQDRLLASAAVPSRSWVLAVDAVHLSGKVLQEAVQIVPFCWWRCIAVSWRGSDWSHRFECWRRVLFGNDWFRRRSAHNWLCAHSPAAPRRSIEALHEGIEVIYTT